MKRGFKIYAIAWVILLALFNVIAFVSVGWIGTGKYTPSFWIGYVFITIAFVGNLLCARAAFKAENLQKLFYNLPLITISYTALIVSFIIGGLCMLISPLPYWVGIIVCAVVLALFALAIVKAKAAGEIVEKIDEKIKTQTAFIKNLTSDAEGLLARAKSDEVRAECKKVYEAVRYSDPISHESLSVIEAKITVKVDEFNSAVGTDDAEKVKEIADEIVVLVGDRNKKCKEMK